MGKPRARPRGPPPPPAPPALGLPGQPWNSRLLLCGAGKLGSGVWDPMGGGKGEVIRLGGSHGVCWVSQHMPHVRGAPSVRACCALQPHPSAEGTS